MKSMPGSLVATGPRARLLDEITFYACSLHSLRDGAADHHAFIPFYEALLKQSLQRFRGDTPMPATQTTKEGFVPLVEADVSCSAPLHFPTL